MMSPFSSNVLREGERKQEFGGNPSGVRGSEGRRGSWVLVPVPNISRDTLRCHSQACWVRSGLPVRLHRLPLNHLYYFKRM